MTVQGKSFTVSAVLMLATDLLNKAGHFLCGLPEINIVDTFDKDECKGWDSLQLCGLTHCSPLGALHLSILLFNALVHSQQEAVLFS